ncbi:MAG: amidohydrolase family protein [Clostridioides sp.]|jgi:L-fuconolactonase|nr:amidohydrolase family protein [Clostridioides sp.]
MLDCTIVDTHVHLWDLNKLRYPWLDDNEFLNHSFLLDEYNKATSQYQVEKMIFMQCECDPSQHLQEVAFATELAKIDERIKGIIPWAPLELGNGVEEELDSLSKNSLVKGIRRIIQFEEDLEFCLKEDFIKGVNLLPKYNFTFDICIDYRHNQNVLKFIDKCENVNFILDHIGKPNIRGKEIEQWSKEIKEFAKFPNVHCKVSSIATEADHKNWTVEELKPYSDCIFENFGFDRTIFAGDWPVSTQAATYSTSVETLLELIKGSTKEERYKLFHANAEKFYNV